MKAKHNIAACLAVAGIMHFAMAQEFNTKMSYAQYHVVGFFENTVVKGMPKGNVYFITSNPEMAVIFTSSASTESMLRSIATGTISNCWRLPDKNKQDFINLMIPLQTQLPHIELGARQEAARAGQELSEEVAQQIEQLKIQSKFFSLAGLDLPYFTCKQI